jgi:hypothetical protein
MRGIKVITTEHFTIAVTCGSFYHQTFDLTVSDVITFRQEIPIHIPKPIQYNQFEVKLSLQQTHTEMKEIGCEKWYIQGGQEKIAAMFLEYCQLDASIPANVSILTIQPHPDLHHKYSFTLTGKNVRKNLELTQCLNHSITSINTFIKNRKEQNISMKDVFAAILTLSDRLPGKIHNWLEWLRATYQDDCYLMIIDTTTLEIPWEMIKVNDNQYLGVLMRVAHWLPRGEQPLKDLLTIQNVQYEGSVISYLDKM